MSFDYRQIAISMLFLAGGCSAIATNQLSEARSLVLGAKEIRVVSNGTYPAGALASELEKTFRTCAPGLKFTTGGESDVAPTWTDDGAGHICIDQSGPEC